MNPTLLRRAAAPLQLGKLTDAVGLVLEARGCRASLGDVFAIESEDGDPVQAEVVGLRGDRTLLMPLGHTAGLEIGMPLRQVGRSAKVAVGEDLLGRVVSALGVPLDGGPELELDETWPLDGEPSHPLNRRPVDEPLAVGVRAIDGLLTMGVGQRIGIFAGGGVGKSSLLAMMVRRAQCDVCVVGLIGERGREVEELVHRTLGEGLARSVVVAATSADTPLARARGAKYATSIAEYFRSKGLRVLLVMDSVTRFAMALREIGLAVGEPPTTKGYTPTVFAALPRLMERAGTSVGPGSITAVYTVLVEGDDLGDPIADASRAILDGHIVLKRELAERGHFPAIDIASSISRVMRDVALPGQLDLAHRAREMLAAFREAEDLMAIGAYQPGALPRLDEAVQRTPALTELLREPLDGGGAPIDETLARLAAVWSTS